ncbi:MAG: hypothetical protein CME13_01870 [Gemmatimonadetes bacterium]|nr:hypothetical protein [Gemmatimonadota bacterium]MDP7364908.1 Gfo/Idh/MocA family oxidoreductase [Candidatus Latescibacterota bacterium]
MKTAVIGGGVMGREHLKALAQISQVDVAAVVDPDLEAASSVLEIAGIKGAQTYADTESMLRAVAPDYVIVASPVRFHAQQTIAAYEAGAHVLCEKPLCMSLEEAHAMKAAGEKAGKLFTMGLQMRQGHANQALRRFVADGGLGSVYHTRAWGGHIMNYPWGRYFHKKDQSLGGVLAATTVHPLDAVYWIIGAPEPVTVSGSTFCRLTQMPNPPINFDGDLKEVTVEDFGQAHVRFADGSSMSVEGNWLQHDRSRAHGFDVLGTLGVGKDVEPHIEVWDPETGAVTGVDLPFEEETASRTLAEHTNFLAAIGGADVSLVRFEEAINVQRIIGGIYASAATGAEVRV